MMDISTVILIVLLACIFSITAWRLISLRLKDKIDLPQVIIWQGIMAFIALMIFFFIYLISERFIIEIIVKPFCEGL